MTPTPTSSASAAELRELEHIHMLLCQAGSMDVGGDNCFVLHPEIDNKRYLKILDVIYAHVRELAALRDAAPVSSSVDAQPSSLLDGLVRDAFRVLQHDTGPQDAEHVWAEKQLRTAFQARMKAAAPKDAHDPRFPGSGPVGTFKAFHSSLCRRFGYTHDEEYWWRDLISLEEHIAKGYAIDNLGSSDNSPEEMVAAPKAAQPIAQGVTDRVISQLIHAVSPHLVSNLPTRMLMRAAIEDIAPLLSQGAAKEAKPEALPLLWEIYHHAFHIFEDTSLLCVDEMEAVTAYDREQIENLSRAIDLFEDTFPEARHGEHDPLENLYAHPQQPPAPQPAQPAPDAVRALPEKWRTKGVQSAPGKFWIAAGQCTRCCADELESALAATPPVGATAAVALLDWMRDPAKVIELAEHLESIAWRPDSGGDPECIDQAAAMSADVIRKVLLPMIAPPQAAAADDEGSA